MKKKILILLAVLIVGGGAAAGVCWKMGLFGSSDSDKGMAFVTQISEINGEDSGISNRYAGVVEAQETIQVKLESGRTVKEVAVKVGDEVKQGQLLFEYDLSSLQDSLEEAQLAYDQLVNEAASLSEQIAALEKEKKSATSDNQLSYTIEIETNKMNLKKNEYNQKTKQSEITKLQEATANTEVRSSIDGIIQKIDTSQMSSADGSSSDNSTDTSGLSSSSSGGAFITILSTGAYRVKGTVNELNISNIIEGEPVIVRSRADQTQTWKGTMGAIDNESASTNSNSSYSDSGSSQTSSSTYPFYVSLDSSDGLMLGQHVYIEMDEGQDDVKAGLWLSEYYIVDADTDSPYVWAKDDKDKLEKRSVMLGQYDDELFEYEIADGLTSDDYIAFPADLLEEGMSTTTDSSKAIDMDAVSEDDSTDLGDYDLGSADGEVLYTDEDMEADEDMSDIDMTDEEMTDTDMTDTDMSDTEVTEDTYGDFEEVPEDDMADTMDLETTE